MGEPPTVRPSDKRQHPRYDVSIPAECSTRQSFFSDYVCNISRGGLFLRADRPLPLDEEVSLLLRLPGTQRGIFATGRVIWSRDIAGASPQVVPGSGIRFVGMTASDRAALETYLAGLTQADTKPPVQH